MARRRRDFGMIRQLPSGRFQASYQAPDGTRRNAPKTFRTKTEAGSWLADLRTQLDKRTWHDPKAGDVTLAEWVEVYATTNRKIKKESTRELLHRDAAAWIVPRLELDGDAVELGSLPIGTITEDLVDRWYPIMRGLTRAAAVKKASASKYKGHPARWWAQNHGYEVKPTGRLSPAIITAWEHAGSPTPPPRPVPEHAGHDYAARQYRLLHALMEYAVKKKKIVANPVNIEGAGEDINLDRIPVEIHEARIMAVAFPRRYRAALWFAVFTALRAGQVFALRRRDIDFERGIIAVGRAQWEPRRGPVRIDSPKTEDTSRWTPMHPQLALFLKAHLDEFVPDDPDAIVFATSTGKPLRASNRSRMFNRAREAAGRPDVRWHDLRSVALMKAFDNGATPKDAMAILDHKTPEASLRYQRTSEQRKKKVLVAVGDAFAEETNVVPLVGQQDAA
ncbi:tyrosine-type recombinase/integrase [Streptomyces abikoensis]|uniref:tyrosine-type recombinase/integrase n=1 Tax=Streptomyces abikoensis TaxID=97398 RepID=UPI00372379A1